jgi:hypothetical protein
VYTTYFLLHPPNWLEKEWFLGAVVGAVFGAIAAIVAQFIYDKFKEERRISVVRAGVYEFLAEIFFQYQALVLGLNKDTNEAARKNVLLEYLKSISVPRHDKLLEIAKQDRAKLRPEVDVFEDILLLVAEVEKKKNWGALNKLGEKFMSELKMGHLNDPDLKKALDAESERNLRDLIRAAGNTLQDLLSNLEKVDKEQERLNEMLSKSEQELNDKISKLEQKP